MSRFCLFVCLKSLKVENISAIPVEYLNPDLLEILESRLINSILYFDQFPIRPTRGFILHGQSGVGKTELLKYIESKLKTRETRFEFFWINSTSDLEAFRQKRAKNAILILDNFENFSNKDVNKTFVSDLLTEIDQSPVGHFYVIGTNRIDLVDERLRNNGRFEIEIDVPTQNLNDRLRVFPLTKNGNRFPPNSQIKKIPSNRRQGF